MNNQIDLEGNTLIKAEHTRQSIRQKKTQDKASEHSAGQARVLENKRSFMY